MSNWDRNQWQGRSQQNVEGTYKINAIIITAFIITLIGLFLIV